MTMDDEAPETRPILSRINDWTLLGSSAKAPVASVPSRISGPAVLLALVLGICSCIYAIKCVIGYRELRPGAMPLNVFDPDEPTWRSVPEWLGKTWLCCAEDFATGIGLLLVGVVFLWLLSRPWLIERHPRLGLVARGGFWTVVFLASFVAMGFMIVNMFVYFNVSRFLTQKMLLMAGTGLEKSVRDEVTLERQLILFLVPLGVITLQLFLVGLLPRWWQWAAYWVCRPVVLAFGVAVFIGLTIMSRSVLGEDFGGFQHNPHVYLVSSYLPGGWQIDEVPLEKDADFLPGDPAIGNLKLEKRPKNIILIVLESTGSQWMHEFGGAWKNTPNLERMVEKEKKGLAFDTTYAISDHTIASAISLFSSMNNHDTENCAVYAARDFPGPNRDFPVPAASTWLKNHDYRTYFTGAGGDAVWEKYKNLGRAFLPYGFDIAKDGSRHWGKEKPNWGFKGDKHDDASMFADAYRCIDDAQEKKQKFFLMMWNYDTHWTYTDGEGPEETWDEAKMPALVLKDQDRLAQFQRYLKAIWRMDRLIGKLYQDLERRGIADDTLIVITGDHGQSFGHHGIWTHGYKLYEEEVRVPLIMINKQLGEYAAENKLGPHNANLCSHIDIWPTIMEICGLPSNSKWQGKSIFNTEIEPAKRHVYMWVGGLSAIREGNYKYIWDKEDSKEYLFNIKDDPAEQTNLLEKERNRALEMRHRLHMWMGWQAYWNEKLLREGKRD
jgi:arylsulfatase A-like enzyme